MSFCIRSCRDATKTAASLIRSKTLHAFVILLVLASVGLADTRVAVIGPRNTELGAFVALAELKVGKIPGVAMVERGAIELVLKEQELQSAFSAEAAGKRALLGKLLRADVLVLLKACKKPSPHTEVVICETQQGLRLSVTPLPRLPEVERQAEKVRQLVEQAIGRKQFSEIVAVVPLINNSLTRDLDHLQTAYAQLIEQSFLRRKQLAVVELAEAKAIADEILLTSGQGIKRPLPLYLIGEYRAEKSRITFTLKLMRGPKQLESRRLAEVVPDQVSELLCRAANEMLDRAVGRSEVMIDREAETDQLNERVEAFLLIGNWSEALTLAEASLLINPDQPKVHDHALQAIAIMIGKLRRSPSIAGSYDNASKSIPLMFAALPHVEAFFAGEVHGRQNWGWGTFCWHPDLRWSSPIKASQKYLSQETFLRWMELRERLASMATRVLKSKAAGKVHDDSLHRLWHLTLPEYHVVDPKVYRRENLKDVCDARLELLKDFVWLKRSPNYRYWRTQEFFAMIIRLDYQSEYYKLSGLHADPIYQEFLAEVEKLHNPAMSKAVEQVRKNIKSMRRHLDNLARAGARPKAAQPKPSRPKPAEDAGKHINLDAVLHPIDLTVERHDGSTSQKVPELLGWLPIQEGMDMVISGRSLHLMKQKGRLKQLPLEFTPIEQDKRRNRRTVNFCWDGRYVWGASPGHKDQFLAVVDPETEEVWKFTAEDGLPPMNTGGGVAITAMTPGKVCIAGYFGRSWYATATFDPEVGKSFEVFHEGRIVARPQEYDSPKRADFAHPFKQFYTIADPAFEGRPPRPLGLLFPHYPGYPFLIDPDKKSLTPVLELGKLLIPHDKKGPKVFKDYFDYRNYLGRLLYRQVGNPDRSPDVWRSTIPDTIPYLNDGVCTETIIRPIVIHERQLYVVTRASSGQAQLYAAGSFRDKFHLLKTSIPQPKKKEGLMPDGSVLRYYPSVAHALHARSHHYGLLLQYRGVLYQVERLKRPTKNRDKGAGKAE